MRPAENCRCSACDAGGHLGGGALGCRRGSGWRSVRRHLEGHVGGCGRGRALRSDVRQGSDGKLAASVSVGTDMGDYNAKFSTVTVTGDKLAGAYDYPPDPQGEVIITGSFDAKNAIGTWSLGAKGQPGGQAIAGTWKVTKQ